MSRHRSLPACLLLVVIPLTALRVTALRPCAVPLALASAAPLPFPPPPPAFIPGLWQQAPAELGGGSAALR